MRKILKFLIPILLICGSAYAVDKVATTTTNYGIYKIQEDDTEWAADQNTAMDTIDTQLKTNADNIATNTADIATNTSDIEGKLDITGDQTLTGDLTVIGDASLDGNLSVDSLRFSAGTATISSVLDEDAMGSDSATALATQQSIKAYVDAQVSGGSGTPGGSDGHIQYNNGGSFGGFGNFDDTNTIVNLPGDLSIDNGLTVDNGVLFVDAGTNRVGINTVSPEEALHIVGDAIINGNLSINQALTVLGLIYAEAGFAGGNLTASSSFWVGSNELANATGIDGEHVRDDTIDDDSIDFSDVTLNDFTNDSLFLKADDSTIDFSGIVTFGSNTTVSGIVFSYVQEVSKSGSFVVSGSEAFGGVFYVDGQATVTLPSVSDGMWISIHTIGATGIQIDPNASDKIWLDGSPLDDGDKINNLSTSGDIAVLKYYSADGWHASTNSWTDGG